MTKTSNIDYIPMIERNTIPKKYNSYRDKNWDDDFMEILKIFEKHSKCSARKVCCIITKDNNIISIGLNGTLSGKTNCNDIFKKENDKWYRYEEDYFDEETGMDITALKRIDEKDVKTTHHYWSLLNEIHAEQNAIYKATQEMNCNIAGSTIYVSSCPCMNCSKMLALYNVKRIVFRDDYDNSEDVINFLNDCNIEVVKYYK